MKSQKKTGPEADTLKLSGNWKDAMAHSLKKKRPKDGWPKPPKKK